jgi:hypothetical protein
MISYNRFTLLLHKLFLRPLHLESIGFDPHYSTNYQHLTPLFSLPNLSIDGGNGNCVWWHEEPLNHNDLTALEFFAIQEPPTFTPMNPHCYTFGPESTNPGQLHDVKFTVFANSEKSLLKKEWLKSYPYLDWYFFFHGFIALDWFRDYRYINFEEIEVSKVFICLNHLVTDNRSYRLNLLSRLNEYDLFKHGHVSAPLLNKNLIKSEIFSNTSKLSVDSKKHILKNLYPGAQPIILDSCDDYNIASANIANPIFSYGALWHIVPETVFYDDKLHLTEKIFKPIVCKRPFILVSSKGNLQYLQNYGFKTFDKWIDESYDTEDDPDIRIDKIILQIKKLCQLSTSELKKMHREMEEILEFNYNHFYGDFKEIIIEELIDNFKKCVFMYNKDRSERFQLPEKNLNYTKIKQILLK